MFRPPGLWREIQCGSEEIMRAERRMPSGWNWWDGQRVEFQDVGSATEELTREVNDLVGFLQAGVGPMGERRRAQRRPFRTHAWLETEDGPGERPRLTPLFTRDITAGAVGFLSREPLPADASGWVYLHLSGSPDGPDRMIPCTVLRCACLRPGWFEGALQFATPHPELLDDA
jgi:hypothetical protein